MTFIGQTLPPSFCTQMFERIGIVSPTFQPKRCAIILPTIVPVRSLNQASFCSGGSVYSGYTSKNVSTSTANVGDLVAIVLVDAAEPVERSRDLHAFDRADAVEVALRQRLDDGHLVHRHQAVRTGELGTAGERDAQRLHQAEQQERDDDGSERQPRAQLLAPEVRPEQRQVLEHGSSVVRLQPDS